jgi:hypothetical protein
MDRPKKITPEISNYIETFSLLYSTLTNEVIANFAASVSSVSAERVRLGLFWRPWQKHNSGIYHLIKMEQQRTTGRQFKRKLLDPKSRKPF